MDTTLQRLFRSRRARRDGSSPSGRFRVTSEHSLWVDADNVGSYLLPGTLRILARQGVPIDEVRAYGRPHAVSPRRFSDVSHLRLSLHPCACDRARGENGTDLALVTDLTVALLTGQTEQATILTDDRDFLTAATRLQARGARVQVAAPSAMVDVDVSDSTDKLLAELREALDEGGGKLALAQVGQMVPAERRASLRLPVRASAMCRHLGLSTDDTWVRA